MPIRLSLDVPIGRSCLDSSQCLGGYGVHCKDVENGTKQCACIDGYEARQPLQTYNTSPYYFGSGSGDYSDNNLVCVRGKCGSNILM